ncbi:MAG: DUF2062 domain-containing protein [Thermodesulfobacteriota bacterium]|nr:DUF2062 domain-containing protein [Thermodesulfobacteriota bacterium]
MNDLRRIIRYYYIRFIRLHGDPEFLARGTALGVFIGITPTIPLHTILALTISYVLRASRIAALLATVAVSNPITFFFQYYFSWRIGKWLTGSDLSWDRINAVLEILTSHSGFKAGISALGSLGWSTIITLVLGGCLLAAPFALISYIFSRRFFLMVRVKREKKKLLKMKQASSNTRNPQ